MLQPLPRTAALVAVLLAAAAPAAAQSPDFYRGKTHQSPDRHPTRWRL